MERKNKKTAYVKSAFKLTIEVFSENEQELVDQVVPGAPPRLASSLTSVNLSRLNYACLGHHAGWGKVGGEKYFSKNISCKKYFLQKVFLIF